MNITRRLQERDRTLAGARLQAEFITANIHHLAAVDTDGRMRKAADDFARMFAAGESLSPRQLNYLDGIYEAIFEAVGFGGCRRMLESFMAKRKGGSVK